MVLARQADAAAALEHAHRAEQAAAIAKALAILEWVDAARVDESKLMEGAERWIPGGADGTPHIAEFVVGGIAAMLGISPESGFCRVASLLNLRHRHPSLYRGAIEGDIPLWQAQNVADRCSSAGLSAEACRVFDRLCETALRYQPWSRVRTNIDRWIIQADPALAAERAERAKVSRFVRVGQFESGQCSLWGQLDAADGVAFDQAIDMVADTLPEGHRDHRRAVAVGVIARSLFGQDQLALPSSQPDAAGSTLQMDAAGSAPHPDALASPAQLASATSSTRTPLRPFRKAEIVVRISAADVLDPACGVAEVDRRGHLLTSQLPDLLQGCHVTVRPVVDAAALPSTDSYAVPPRMRTALEVRNPVDAFPFGARRASNCDADHTVPFNHEADAGAGQTHLGNLAPLSRYAHRLKTHGGWHLDQPSPGVLVWTSPLGYRYLVTPDGTTTIGRPQPRGDEWWSREEPAWLSVHPDDPEAHAGPPPDPGPRQTPLPLQAPAA